VLAPLKTLILQLRCQRWIGNALLHKFKIATSSNCPHCHADSRYDNGLHTLAGCEHPTLAGMCTYRHDHAAHTIADAISKSHHERPFCLLISAGKRYREGNGSPFSPAEALIPAWALPGNTLAPDLVLILGWEAGMPPPTAPTPDIEFVIGDVSYGAGWESLRHVRDKQAKYAALALALRQRGWRVRGASPDACEGESDDTPPYADIFAFSLGTTGEIYKSTLNSARAFDIEQARLKPLMDSLHLLAITHARDMIKTRRRKLDADARSGAQPPPGSTTRRGEG
jgi:glutaredoxin